MSVLEKYQELSDELDSLKSQQSKIEGVLESLHEKLLEQFECESVEDAQTLLHQLQSKKAKLDKRIAKKLAAYEKQYHD